MDTDLLFTAIDPAKYKEATRSGRFEPESLREEGWVRCFDGKSAEEILNDQFGELDEVLLIVIDPLRIQDPVKREKIDGHSVVTIKGTFSIDSIIDKIKLLKSKKGRFQVQVSHFD